MMTALLKVVCAAEGHDLRVRASVCHGEHERLVVGALEVLVGELLAVDGLAAGALMRSAVG